VARALAALIVLASLLTCATARAGSGATSSSAPTARLTVRPARLSYLGGRVSLAWSARHAKTCTLSVHPRLWLGRVRRRVRCDGRSVQALHPASFAARWTLTFRARDASGRVAVARRKLVLRAPPFPVSANWSGYVVPSSTLVTEVSGQFTVPRLDCSGGVHAGASTWVGIGGAGMTAGSLLQTGVRSVCVSGTQTLNEGWWAEFPKYPEVDFGSQHISTGDSVRATVARNADGSWTTRLDDLTTGISGVLTTGQSYGTVLDSQPATWLKQEGSASGAAYSGGRTAEWIVEDFEQADMPLIPLADFGSIAFTGLTASVPSWGLTADERVGLGDADGNLWAVPTPPDSSGRGFSVRYTG
jgi:peptidase A4-like protein